MLVTIFTNTENYGSGWNLSVIRHR